MACFLESIVLTFLIKPVAQLLHCLNWLSFYNNYFDKVLCKCFVSAGTEKDLCSLNTFIKVLF